MILMSWSYELMAQWKKPKVNQLGNYAFMVKRMFEAVHFDTHFNPIMEEAAEWK